MAASAAAIARRAAAFERAPSSPSAVPPSPPPVDDGSVASVAPRRSEDAALSSLFGFVGANTTLFFGGSRLDTITRRPTLLRFSCLFGR